MSNNIPHEDIKKAAIQYAQQEGWSVRLQDCTIQPIRQTATEQDGSRVQGRISLPATSWLVYITPSKSTNSPHVIVTLLSGALMCEFKGSSRK